MEQQISKLIIPVKLNYLPVIQAFIRENALMTKFSTKDIMFFNIAVEEAVTNVVKHAFLPDEDASFDVICEITPVEFKVIINDQGLPFDPEQVEEYNPEKELDGDAHSGLGFRLMKGSVDKLSFHNKGFGGKEVHLVKFIEQKHIDQFVQTSEMGAYEQPVQKIEETQKIAFHTELLQKKQAIEISQCAYKTYGYTYIMENIYYPERLIEMTNTGELISAVAVTDDTGEVMSHAALERFGRKRAIPEIGMAFTKPKFRGQGCLTKLSALLLDKAKSLGIKGIYAKAVTTHPYSQKPLVKGGYKDSAILIGLSPAKKFAKMDAQGAQRESLILSNLKLLEQDKLQLFTLEKHKAILEKIYANLQIDAQINLVGKTVKIRKDIIQSDLEIEVYDNLHYANMYVTAAGENLPMEIKHRLKELCQKKIEAVNLYLNLCDEYSMSKVEELEELGFFFAGAFPNDQKQFLILQFLNNVPIDYSKIVTFSDFSKELIEYVKEMDPNLK
ncbi:MAG: ATP-binding protein [Paludibacter sp.]|nr:ATP-binding protein [Paludibacter sp.]